MRKYLSYAVVIVFLSILAISISSSPVIAADYYGVTRTTDSTFGSGDHFYNKEGSLWPPALPVLTALRVTGGTTTLNGSTVLGWRGIFVSPSGSSAGLVLNGASVSTRVNIIPGSYWAAVALEGTGAWAEIYNSTITGNGVGTHGVLAADSAEVEISDSSVTVNGIGSNGLYAEDGGSIGMTGGSVSTSGLAASHAVRSSGDGSEIALDGVAVQTSGVWDSPIGLFAYGLYADDGGSIEMSGGSVSTLGALSHAVLSEGEGSSVTLTNGTAVSATGTSAYGLYAEDGGSIGMTGGTVSTSGLLGSHAVRSSGDGSEIALDGVAVQTSGVWDSPVGLFAYGLYADDGGSIEMSGGSVSTSGALSHAVVSEGDGSSVMLSDGTIISTTGLLSYGLYATDGGYISMTGGTVSSLSGRYMYVSDGGHLDLSGVTAGEEDAESLIVTDSSGIVNAADGTNLTGNVRHTGDSDGELDLTLSTGSSLTGTVNSNINNLNSGINVTLSDNSALWNVTGDSITDGSLANAGTVDYQFSGTVDPATMSYVVPDSDYSGYKEVSAADFTGLIDSDSGIPGTLKMKADITANEGDLLYIAGTATGENLVDVQIISNSGADRMDGLIEVDDSEATASFSLADPDGVVDAGAWNYILAEGTVGSAKEWYLKRNGLTTVGRGIVSSLVGSDIWYTEVDTLFNRTGMYKDDYAGGVWANVAAKKSEFSPENGIEFEQKFKTISLGYDKKVEQKEGSPALYQGVMVGYGTADRDISDSIGNTDIDSFHATFYSLFRWSDGLYLTGLLKYNHYKTDMTITRLDDFSANLGEALGFNAVTGKYEQDGFGFSLMAGKRLDTGKDGWYWEPQLQLSWMRMSGDDYTTNSGIDVNISSSNSLQARGGILFGKSFETAAGSMLDLYAKVSIVHEFDGETDLTMSGARYTSDLSGTWGVYGVGMNWQIGKGQFINANFNYADGSGRTDPWAAQLGFSLEM
ncbi:MAG: autotransporter outer membrane beta-barrel domain-containing protein [Synergistaceae bacterium]|nr:autotransporter outer membrane beta-barrel domain-containing protein [Synergistaceae bacterium]